MECLASAPFLTLALTGVAALRDYNSLPQYAPFPSSGRMGIILRNCSGVHIAGLTIDSTGGDGIYIGRNHEPAPGCSNESSVCHGVARNVHIEDVRSL